MGLFTGKKHSTQKQVAARCLGSPGTKFKFGNTRLNTLIPTANQKEEELMQIRESNLIGSFPLAVMQIILLSTKAVLPPCTRNPENDGIPTLSWGWPARPGLQFGGISPYTDACPGSSSGCFFQCFRWGPSQSGTVGSMNTGSGTVEDTQSH